jgi:hypothetical protein
MDGATGDIQEKLRDALPAQIRTSGNDAFPMGSYRVYETKDAVIERSEA